MKKVILGAIAIVALSNYSFGQGQVQINNTSTASTKIFVNAVDGGQSAGQTGALMPAAAAGTYTFELFYNTTVNTAAGTPNVADSATPWLGGGWVDAGANDQGLSTGTAGRINDSGNVGLVILPTSASSAVGVQANLEMIGWNTAIGGSSLSTFETAYTAALGAQSTLLYGYSAVANILLGNNASPGNSNFFSPAAGGVSGFTLGEVTPTPEPTSMVLAGLGGLSLLALRRKK
jgi:hypothetical protein